MSKNPEMDVYQDNAADQARAAKFSLQELLAMIGGDHGATAGIHVDTHTEAVLWAAECALRYLVADNA